MAQTLIPLTAADTPTLYPAEPPIRDPFEPTWHTWIPSAPWEAAIPTRLLPPEKPAPPIRIPSNHPITPTEMLPPALVASVGGATLTAPVPPPDLFSLLGASAPAAAATAPATAAAAAAAAEPAAASVSVPAPVPAPALLPLDHFVLERCAIIEASLALHPDAAGKILDAHALDAATWTALRRHWHDRIRAELRHGNPSLLRAHDAAFVARIEKERGPITREVHARLIAAAERGNRAETLAALALPHAAVLPIERVFLARMACSNATNPW